MTLTKKQGKKKTLGNNMTKKEKKRLGKRRNNNVEDCLRENADQSFLSASVYTFGSRS